MSREPLSLVLDTNVFVSAAFNPASHSARIIRQAEQGRWRIVWNEDTRRETLRILSAIPPISAEQFASVFKEENRFPGETHPERFSLVEDPDDRVFAGLAAATGAILVTSDDDLLSVRDRLDVEIVTPGELLRRRGRAPRVSS
jgi:predicted nucleic acid-binding protein